ncbi:hypothetical protein QFZ37_001467 [Chryseobacterium ginsenosidimutans]|uniref:hypothetical protein n=1 Tax=Chryseobacterium ginsenosidimutans TaxID=687846 RepID=UPI0027803230|nr:hypothetical protein [Chryseobacterium ginsenosidimutans]MDQ0593098.1 hypothetical protein [Chryseobacterium ginsenosidimutans]
MESDENQFPVIHSKISKGWTVAIKAFGSIFAVLIPLMMILMTGFTLASESIKFEIKILIVVLAILIIGLFVWLLIVQIRKKSTTKIIRVTVDKTGIHHYSNKGLVKSIQYNQLMPDPENGKYDFFIYLDQTDTNMDLCFYVLDDAVEKVVRKALFIEGDFVITNGNTLKKHFIKGIIMFRPDLKIDPGVLDMYKLNEEHNNNPFSP